MTVTVAGLWTEAQSKLRGTGPGEPLSELEEALIELGVAAAVTSLDPEAIDAAIARGLAAGADASQLQEVVSLISGLGVHSLMITATRIVSATELGSSVSQARTAEQRELWERYVGDDPYWLGFESEAPGFLNALLMSSAEQFAAFFEYCAVPWKSRSVGPGLKELIAMATDATPTHRFLPGFRLHLSNAMKLGAGRSAVERTLEIAASAPLHRGTW